MSIGALVNYRKARYAVLTEIFKNRKIDNMNIVIPLDDILKTLFSHTTLLNLNSSIQLNQHELASIIINTVGYYRKFFSSRFNVLTNIMLINNYQPNHYDSKFVIDRGMSTSSSLECINMYDYVKAEINTAKIVLDFIPNTNIIDIKYPEVAYPSIIFNRLKRSTNIIVSNNEIYLQYVNDETFVLTNRGDTTELIDLNNVRQKLTSIKYQTEDLEKIIVGKNLVNGYKLFGGTKFTMSSAMKMIGMSWAGCRVRTLPVNDDILVTNIEESIELSSILNVHPLVVLINEVESQIINRRDEHGLKQLNNQVFNEYPIILDNFI